ncbi:helix-turn-helix transcriptional regulator [Roseisolibacter agri]|uniref:HTH luxR-type domain-containing protein n=1 Tax=Roseisolibacter agri TaxID=2014610 RepID=A0AA37VAJ4_9BACT|nr:helix-turn-helix transcriptional regulator [Roseisolibacter agri]GLC25498.1 hypothetical protein rosag_20110 [Roseisolibacter agri]
MTLHLTARDTRLLNDAADALLAPIAAVDPRAWWREVEARVQPLFPRANVALGLPEGRHLRVLSESMGATRRDRIGALLNADPRTGQFIVHCDITTVMLETRRKRGLAIWNEAQNGAVLAEIGFDQRRALFYNEGLLASGMHDFSTVASQEGSAELFMQVGYDRAGRARDDDTARLGLLLPALRTAHRAMLAHAAQGTALAAMLDAAGAPVLVIGTDGREAHRSRTLVELLAAEPARDALVAAMHDAARALRAPLSPALLLAPAKEQVVHGARQRYALRATPAPAQLWAAPGTLLVALSVTGAPDATDDALRARYGFTARESEVARLLGQRLTNAELAAALGVSAHTARHHTERVMAKLGVSSRREASARMAEP